MHAHAVTRGPTPHTYAHVCACAQCTRANTHAHTHACARYHLCSSSKPGPPTHGGDSCPSIRFAACGCMHAACMCMAPFVLKTKRLEAPGVPLHALRHACSKHPGPAAHHSHLVPFMLKSGSKPPAPNAWRRLLSLNPVCGMRTCACMRHACAWHMNGSKPPGSAFQRPPQGHACIVLKTWLEALRASGPRVASERVMRRVNEGHTLNTAEQPCRDYPLTSCDATPELWTASTVEHSSSKAKQEQAETFAARPGGHGNIVCR
jgi:hypothetical protein